MAEGRIILKSSVDGVNLKLDEVERQQLKKLLGYRTGKMDEDMGLDTNVTQRIYEALLTPEEARG